MTTRGGESAAAAFYTSSRDSGRNLASFRQRRFAFEVMPRTSRMAITRSIEDTPSQKAGRVLIVVSGILLAAVVSQIGQHAGVPEPAGFRRMVEGRWWRPSSILGEPGQLSGSWRRCSRSETP